MGITKNASFHIISLSDVVHAAKFNSRPGDPYADPFSGKGKELVMSFVQDGWSHQAYGLIEGEKVVKDMRDDFPGHTQIVAAWHEELLAEFDEVKKRYQQRPTELDAAWMKVFDELYRDAKGNMKTPKVGSYFFGTTGHQRARCARWAAAYRIVGGEIESKRSVEDLGISTKIAKGTSYDDIIHNVPIISVSYRDEKHRLLEQIGENEQPNIGKSELTFRDELYLAEKLMAMGFNQNAVRKTLGGESKGQKAYCWQRLDYLHPDMNLLKRVLYLPDAEGNYPEDRLRWQGIKGGKLPLLVKRSSPDTLADHNNRQKELEKNGKTPAYLKPLGDEELEFIIQWEHLGNPKFKPEGAEDKPEQKKSMDAEKFEGVAAGSKNAILSVIQRAHASGDEAGFKPIQDLTPILNPLHMLYKQYGVKTDSNGNMVGVMAAVRDTLEYLLTLKESEILEWLVVPELTESK